MHRRFLPLLTAFMLCLAPMVQAEEDAGFDVPSLEAMTDCTVFLDDNGVDTVVRPVEQPFLGTLDEGDGECYAFLDFVEMPQEDGVFLRLTLSLMLPAPLDAREMQLTVGKTAYTFTVSPRTSEYDTTYFEDYIVCMTDESLPLIKALARSKDASVPAVLTGADSLSVHLTLPPDSVAKLYDAYVDFGGTAQDLESIRELWPVRVQ